MYSFPTEDQSARSWPEARARYDNLRLLMLVTMDDKVKADLSGQPTFVLGRKFIDYLSAYKAERPGFWE